MRKTLTNSPIDRKNILENRFAAAEMRKILQLDCVSFEDELYMTKKMTASFFGTDEDSLEAYIEKYHDELEESGYEILKGERLEAFLRKLARYYGIGADADLERTELGVFNFRAFLNMAMLLTDSENARIIRILITDIATDLVNFSTGGGTRCINKNDDQFINSYLQNWAYSPEFTNALRDCVDMGNAKYIIYTDMIYTSIFKEKSAEYREVLKLQNKDAVRNALCFEALDFVILYEYGIAADIKDRSALTGHKLNNWEVDNVFREFEMKPRWQPLIRNARTQMEACTMASKYDIYRPRYIKPAEGEEYKTEALINDNREILKRLKERD